MFRRLTAAAAVPAFALLAPAIGQAAITSLDLGNYGLTATYQLGLTRSPKAWEASSITWNQDTNSLFVIEDEGRRVYQVSTTGAIINSMTLSGFEDTEGLTYLGNGEFVLAEERNQDLYRFTYTANSTLSRGSLQAVSLGNFVDNIGIEGVSYDPLTGNLLYVKETDPQLVNQAVANFGNGSVSITTLFNPDTTLGLGDLADIQALSTVESLFGTPDGSNLLIVSQASGRLLEVDRSGTVLSYFDLPSSRVNAEGVTIDDQGNIYIVDEGSDGDGNPRMLVYSPIPTPVPLPAAAWLLISGLGAFAGAARRRRAS